jgi:hypothetical protein
MFFGEEKFSEMPSKNKVADEKKLVQSGKFSLATLFFRRQRQMKAGQNNNYDITKTETANRAESGQLQFWSEPSEILNLRSSNTLETLMVIIS